MLKRLRPSTATGVSERDFRDAMCRFASGVTVITTLDGQGGVHGMTATAFCSLSLDPPLILVAVARGTRCHRFVTAEQMFGVNVLLEHQAHLSHHFGGRPSPETRPGFAELDDVPVLDEAMVKLACRLERAFEGGDHTIFVGRVGAVSTSPGKPLLHFEGGLHGLSVGEGRSKV